MVMARSSYFLPYRRVLVAFGCFCQFYEALDGSLRSLVVVDIGEGSCRFWLKLWLVSRVVASFIRCLMALANSRWFLQVQNSCCSFGMVLAGLIWLLVVL